MTQTVETTCPYCGVGCGVLATVDADINAGGKVSISGNPQHPANLGRLCSKGSALGETVDLDGRLLHPEIHGERASWDEALDHVAHGFKQVIEQHGPDAVAFYVSGQLLTEDYYVANKLIKGYIGTANIDTNSRLCMSSSVVGHKRAFGADTVPCSYEDLERAKLIVLVGSNTAWCHPVLYQRIVQAKKDNPDLLIAVIDPRQTATCDLADIHLPIRSGSDATLFNGLLAYLAHDGEINQAYVAQYVEGFEQALSAAQDSSGDLDDVALRCGIELDTLKNFYRLFARTERVITVYSQGINQSSSGSDKVNAIINCHLATGRIGRPGMGPFSFTGQPNAMGGREVGGLANMLAAHMDIENADHRQLVQTFWDSPTLADKPGRKAVDMFNAIADGKIKALWVMATNPVVSMPDADAIKAALKQCELVVVSDCIRNTDTAQLAHVKLPATGWAEKDGTVTNSERRISRQRAFLPAAGEAKGDWWIICQVAKRMGYNGFDYQHPFEIFNEHAALSAYENEGQRDFNIGALGKRDLASYNALQPIQWPVTPERPNGSARMFSDGRYFTPSQKARMLAITPRTPVNAPNNDFPLILNSGRIRDQWHTMTRTGKAARLSEHSPEPYIAIHPEDAARFRIREDQLVSVFSRWGEMIGRARFDQGLRRGDVFAPMHWNEQFASCGRVGAVVNPETDPYSGQPELKHTPVRIAPFDSAWHGFILSRRKLHLHGIRYWARATGNGFYRYELAGDQKENDLPAWVRSYLCSSDNDVKWVELLDKGAHTYRGVRMTGARLESCIFIAPDHALPPRNWLASLFEKEALTQDEKRALLTGKPPAGEIDTGRIVCACFNVGENTILDAIDKHGLKTADEIGKCLNAGTNCGSCVPELKALLQR